MHAPCLPGLFSPAAETPTERPTRVRKNVRSVSRETYNVLADTGALGAACTKVMRSLKWFINKHQFAPTPAELTRAMFIAGVIKRDATNLVAPRLTEMARGKVVRQPDGSTVRTGGREIEQLPLRTCRVTGNQAHPVRPREAGSVEPR